MKAVLAMKLAEYLSRFKSVYGVLTSILMALPLLSLVDHGQIGDHAFPPLGPYQPFWLFVTLTLGAVVILSTYYFLRGSSLTTVVDRRKEGYGGMALLIAGGLISYFAAVQLAVREISIPTEGKTVCVSVGFERTEFARTNYGDFGDWTMLKKAGFDEEQIVKLWTKRSLLTYRTWLFSSYLWSFCWLISLGSFAVLCDLTDNP